MRKKYIILIVAVGIVLVCLILLATRFLLGSTENKETVRIFLPEGATYSDLRDSLMANNVVPIGTGTSFFDIKAKFLKLNQQVRPGSYVVKPRMKELALIRKLRNGQQDPMRLTIGKMRTPEQLNAYLSAKLMHDDFDITIDSFHLVRPNTYEVYWTINPTNFMQRMQREYERFWDSRKTACNLTEKEIIILASIVEEETNRASDKPLVASVYLNRLQKGMALQADPTVKYAVGDFTLRRILKNHLQTPSPFNTYLHPGLPPAPICLPSVSSVDAVINAPQTDYLYFCASPALDGTHIFAATLTAHNANAAAFHRALDKRGIK